MFKGIVHGNFELQDSKHERMKILSNSLLKFKNEGLGD